VELVQRIRVEVVADYTEMPLGVNDSEAEVGSESVEAQRAFVVVGDV
jgi:hypothetical protein